MPDYVPTLTPVFYRLIQAAAKQPRYILSCGGTRSGKTFSGLQLLYFLANKDRTPSVNSVVSETFPHLKRGAMRDFQMILGPAFRADCWSRSDSVYRCPDSGSIIEFFSADAPSKVHGPARKRLFLNEGQNIEYDIARQLFVRTSGLILIDYNPVESFWADQKIQPRDNCQFVHSTFRDNSFLTAEQVAEIESNQTDAGWWTVYGEGKTGTRQGLIYSFDQVDAMPDPHGLVEAYGLDFGFTNDPSVLVRVLIDTRRDEAFVDQLLYRKGMFNKDIAAEMKRLGIGSGVPVWADSGEPKSVEELHQYGFNVKGCYKSGRKSEQINRVKAFRMHVTKRSVDIVREARQYAWETDKNGNNTNEPSSVNDHAMDAIRYAIFNQVVRPSQTTSFSRT